MGKTQVLNGVAAAVLLVTLPAWSADVALVTSLQGKVSLASGAQTSEVKPYMRLSDGAVLRVPSGAQIQVTFLDNGRQEIWPQNTQFKVEGRKGVSVQGQPSMVRTLPQMVLNQLRDSPVSGAGVRIGAVRVRAVEGGGENGLNPVKQREIETNYQQLRNDAARDLVPEMYRLSAFYKAGAYDEVLRIAKEVRSQDPQNTDAAELAQRFEQAVAQAKQGTSTAQ